MGKRPAARIRRAFSAEFKLEAMRRRREERGARTRRKLGAGRPRVAGPAGHAPRVGQRPHLHSSRRGRSVSGGRPGSRVSARRWLGDAPLVGGGRRVRRARHHLQHESPRQLLARRRRRNLLRDARARAARDPALRVTSDRAACELRVHRGLVQSAASSFHARLRQPGGVRAAASSRLNLVSTKSGELEGDEGEGRSCYTEPHNRTGDVDVWLHGP